MYLLCIPILHDMCSKLKEISSQEYLWDKEICSWIEWRTINQTQCLSDADKIIYLKLYKALLQNLVSLNVTKRTKILFGKTGGGAMTGPYSATRERDHEKSKFKRHKNTLSLYKGLGVKDKRIKRQSSKTGLALK